MERTGKCLCGAVSFLAKDLEPNNASVCHCKMCQRWAGGPWVAVPVGSLEFDCDDGLHFFESSKIAERGFCNQCGSTLFWRLTAEGKYQGTTTVTLGCLDDPPKVELKKEWFIDYKPDSYSFAGERTCITEKEAMAMFKELF